MSVGDQPRLPDGEQYYYANYFLKIEALFAALRGRSLLLSPADYQLARSWYERGVPLSCVLRGIRAAYFKKLAEAEEPEDEEVRSLSWCRWAVVREWKEYRSVPVGPSGAEPTPPEKTGDEIDAILDGLLFDLARARDLQLAEGREELARQLGGLHTETVDLRANWSGGAVDLESLEARLRELDVRMLSAAEENLDPETCKKIERSIARKLRPHAEAMDTGTLDRTRRAAFRAKLRIVLDLPLLTLYSFSY